MKIIPKPLIYVMYSLNVGIDNHFFWIKFSFILENLIHKNICDMKYMLLNTIKLVMWIWMNIYCHNHVISTL